MIWNIISFKKPADTSDYESKESHKHIHTQQVWSFYIDHWNNNKASLIDFLVLSVYEIQAMLSNQGHYSIPGKSEQKREQESSINHYFL